MARKEHHVVPNKNGGWDVKINDAGHRTYHTRKKSTAVRKARAISRRHGSELVIHNSKGQIEVKNSHPHPTKRRKKAKKVAKRSAKKNKKVVKKAKKVVKRKTRPMKKKAKKVTKRVSHPNKKKAKKSKRNRRRR